MKDLGVANGLVIELEQCSAAWHNKSLRLPLVRVVSPLGIKHLCVVHLERHRMHGKSQTGYTFGGKGVYSALAVSTQKCRVPCQIEGLIFHYRLPESSTRC